MDISFVLPRLISAIRNFQIFHWNWTNSNPWYIITYKEYDNSNAFFRNLENEKDLYQSFRCQGISYVIILVEKYIWVTEINLFICICGKYPPCLGSLLKVHSLIRTSPAPLVRNYFRLSLVMMQWIIFVYRSLWCSELFSCVELNRISWNFLGILLKACNPFLRSLVMTLCFILTSESTDIFCYFFYDNVKFAYWQKLQSFCWFIFTFCVQTLWHVAFFMLNPGYFLQFRVFPS